MSPNLESDVIDPNDIDWKTISKEELIEYVLIGLDPAVDELERRASGSKV